MQPADFIGIPFAEGGRDPAHGLDCWGLVAAASRGLYGIDLPSYAGCYATPLDYDELRRLIDGEKSAWQPVAIGQERAGDVALLRVRGRPVHVGLVTAKGWMLHVEAGCETVQERYDGPQWKRRLIGVYRFQG
jgi:cell wall-associated NlpC family hydrolase